MADTKKGGNSIVWSWREVGVENCTCMSVAAGMYCGPERTPGIANDSPCGTSCGRHCWDLGYVDAATGYFISKGFPVCGGPDAPPTPDPIAWVEFPTLTDLNTDGVPPCQRRATGLAFREQAGLQAELQDQIFRNTPPIMGIVVSVTGCAAGCGCYGGSIVPNTGGIAGPGCPAGTSCFELRDHSSGSRKPTLYKCGNMGTFPPSSSPCTGSDVEIWQCVQRQTGGGWSQEWRVAQM